MRQWIDGWKAVDQMQRKLRLERLRTIVTSESMAALDSAFESARRNASPRTSSGLVEFHRLLSRTL